MRLLEIVRNEACDFRGEFLMAQRQALLPRTGAQALEEM
jgi:hypothetical protein